MGEGQETSKPEERERPKLRLKRDAPGKACPGCGEKMAEDAVVCMHCGWNCQTGKKAKSAEASMRRKRVLGAVAKFAAVLAVAGAVAAGVRWMLGHREETERWVEEGKERVQALAGSAEVRANEERSSREAVAREQLDREFPLWREGDEVVLEKKNGAVVEGVLRNLREGVATVETPSGTRMVAMGDLSGRSRVRVDGAFREKVIQSRLKKE